jgi:hypothetical protein
VIRRAGDEVEVSDRPIAFWGEFEPNYRPRHDETATATGSSPLGARRAVA